ncbi:hypothetical protein AVEN_117153-1 [Araneus ventricosus]|uniref:Uncharacterized protein n=1 Tax=Araneus ventricosus TaxID=182803 RepID=A0A4Y2AYW5_ARAVE|nr:hypothetical protein AVEN_117153-1 [Araneus ventricosus]
MHTMAPPWHGDKLGFGTRPRKADSIEESSFSGYGCTLNPLRPNVLLLVWHGSFKNGCHVRCCLRHLTTAQNYELRPKMALELLKNGT